MLRLPAAGGGGGGGSGAVSVSDSVSPKSDHSSILIGTETPYAALNEHDVGHYKQSDDNSHLTSNGGRHDTPLYQAATRDSRQPLLHSPSSSSSSSASSFHPRVSPAVAVSGADDSDDELPALVEANPVSASASAPAAVASTKTKAQLSSHCNSNGHGHSHGNGSHEDHDHDHDDHDDDEHHHPHQHQHDREHGDDEHSHEHDDDHGHSHGHSAPSRGPNIKAGSKSSPSSSSSSAGSAQVPPGPPRKHSDSKHRLIRHSKAHSVGTDPSASEQSSQSAVRKLQLVAVCCLIFMGVEIAGGWLANSLAIMTDAAHLMSDLGGFMISIFALWLTSRPATSALSFGFHRAEILGALISVLVIWALTGVLVYEAVLRVLHPQDVDGQIMFIVASAGLVVNIIMGYILHSSGHHGHSHGEGDHGHSQVGGRSSHSHSVGNDHDHIHEAHRNSINESAVIQNQRREKENINVRAAFIHVIGDLLQSVGVMIAAGLIWYKPEWHIADPICTFVFSVLVLFTTVRLVKESVGVLMEGTPDGIEPDQVSQDLLAIKGVSEVHDLHIWSVSVGKPALAVHLTTDHSAEFILRKVNRVLRNKWNITHSTVQVETAADDELACGECVHGAGASAANTNGNGNSSSGTTASAQL